eukprot:6338410-Amphidinium_carterae.1
MSLRWSPAPELPLYGQMDLASDPQHRHYTDTQEKACLPLPGIKQSVYRAEFLLKSANRMKLSVIAKGWLPTKTRMLWVVARLPPTIIMAMVKLMKPRVSVPAETLVEETDIGIVGMVFPEASFQLGPHQRVVRHAAFLQCLDCGRQTRKVKVENICAYRKRQDCNQLKNINVK